MANNNSTDRETDKRLKKQKWKIYINILNYLKSKLAKRVSLFFILLSIFAIIGASFSQMSHLTNMLFSVTYLSSFVFLIEYILRIVSAPVVYNRYSSHKARLKYLCSFYGFVDFIAILPFILTYMYWDSNTIHIIILPYIFTIFKLIRYSRSFKVIGRVLADAKDELITAYTACGIFVCFSAILMYYIERNAQPEAFSNIGDSLWWAIVAFTTVGYGDLYPITPLGRILSGIISIIGIAMIAIPTGIISSSFIKNAKDKNNL